MSERCITMRIELLDGLGAAASLTAASCAGAVETMDVDRQKGKVKERDAGVRTVVACHRAPALSHRRSKGIGGLMSIAGRAKLLTFGLFLVAASTLSTVRAADPACGDVDMYQCVDCPRDIIGICYTTGNCGDFDNATHVGSCQAGSTNYSTCRIDECS
jgi:hypothetical protein